MAQWSIRMKQVIFAVLAVSWTMGNNNDECKKLNSLKKVCKDHDSR